MKITANGAALAMAACVLLGAAGCRPAGNAEEGAGTAVPVLDEFGGPLALRASNGKFICADLADGIPRRGALMANRDSAGGWERFELVKQESGQYALRSSDGKYVSAEREAPFQCVADRDAVKEWELLEVVRRGDGRISLRTTEGKYLSAEQTEGAACHLCIVADRTEPGAWETFEVVRLEAAP